VRVGNELWDAVSDSNAGVEVGAEVVIVGVDKLMLRVRPAAREEQK